MTTIHVLHTGVANLASVRAGLRRAGAEPVVTRDPADLECATHVMLPGVGAFGAGMAALRQTGLDGALLRHLGAGRPVLAICLGLQLLARRSEETPDVDGLGVLDVDVTRFPDTVRVPQFGWNRVVPQPGIKWLREGHAYFANSYRIAEVPEDWSAAVGDHGGPFVAALERGSVLACQFHPELSGDWGQALLRRWLEATAC